MAPTGRRTGLPEHPSAPTDAVWRAAVPHLARRRFFTVAAAAATLAFGTGLPARGAMAAPQLDAARITEDPFTLGVASGDPLPDSVVLWTRLAPAPYEPDGGLGQQRIAVQWEVALDEWFAIVVRDGVALAYPEYGHSVHVDVKGLNPNTPYYYRFRTGAWISPVGRTHTAPAARTPVTSLRLAAVACQAYHDGYYTAYRHLANEDVDLVFHLGDYLYEYAVNSSGGERGYADGTLPDVFDRETMTLADYRMRYALYKTDADLRAAARPSSSCCGGPPPTARTGRTSRCAPHSSPRARTPGCTGGSTGAPSPSSTCSTPASTAPTRPTATARTSRAPSPTTRRAPSPATSRNAG
jgi:alkaline phosphatase/alkaline phosphatase D